MVLVGTMINYKQFYHIDDIVLSSFCPNTNRVEKKEKFLIFREHLHSFHPQAELYENSASEYVGYIVYSILLNSLELNKNILTYEQYFYNVLSGFSEQTGHKISSSNIAKSWNNLVMVYDQLLTLTTASSVIGVRVLQKAHSTLRYINHKDVNHNFYWDIPVQIFHTDGSIKTILILPVRSQTNLFSNFLVLNTIRTFYQKGSLYVLQIFLDKLDLKLSSVNVTKTVEQYAEQFLYKFYVDFSTANIHNCTICPLVSCSLEQMFKVVQPTTAQKLKKIKLVNE